MVRDRIRQRRPAVLPDGGGAPRAARLPGVFPDERAGVTELRQQPFVTVDEPGGAGQHAAGEKILPDPLRHVVVRILGDQFAVPPDLAHPVVEAVTVLAGRAGGEIRF